MTTNESQAGLAPHPTAGLPLIAHHTAVGLGPLKHIAYYSADRSDPVRYDLSCLRAFNEPNTSVPMNLREGLRGCVRRNRTNTTLGHPIPLDDIVGSCAALGTLDTIRNAHVVTWRGILTK